MISLSAWVLVAFVLVVVALAICVGAAISRARRLDRLHQRIIASREALSRLLLRRASEASLLAQTAPFNGGGAEVMRDVARASIHDDGSAGRRSPRGSRRDLLPHRIDAKCAQR